MFSAAVLIAEEVVFAELRWDKPFGGIGSGQDILFYAEGGDGEIVNHILTGKDEFHRPPEREMKPR